MLMTWIDKRLAEQEAEATRSALIDQSAERVYDDLWQAVMRCVMEANNKGFTLATNGSPHQRIVTLTSKDRTTKKRQLQLTLHRDIRLIKIRGVESLSELSLDLCPDRVVCLKLNGKQVTYDEAAEAILDPFLFPTSPTDTGEAIFR
jgi:hypothetical protein